MGVQINKRLLVVKAQYFFFFAAIGCVQPFLSVYIQKLGLSISSISIIYLIMPLTSILAKPLMGNLADYLRRYKSVFIFSIISMTVAYFGISFVPNLNYVTQFTLSCDPSTNNLCPEQPIKCTTDQITCNIENSLNYTRINLTKQGEIPCFHFPCLNNNNNSVECTAICINDGADNYALLFSCMIISAIFCGVSISLADTIAFHVASQENSDYGFQRVWGSIGWGLLTIITGFVWEETGFGQVDSNLNPVFYIFLALCLIDIFISSQLKIGELPKPTHIWKNLGIVFGNLSILLFTLAVFVMGVMTAALWTFQMVYVKNVLGGSAMLFGLIMGVQCFLGEIPFFLCSEYLLRKIGHTQAMPVCLICFAFRFICYSLLTNPWFILPLEIINGVTFGLFFAAVVSFASGNAPPGMSATVQGIFQSVFEGFGVGLGSLISGQMFEEWGGRSMYLYLGIASGCFVLIYEAGVFAIKRLKLVASGSSPVQQEVPLDDTVKVEGKSLPNG